MPFNYVLSIAPGEGSPEIAQLWASRLSDPETINRIKNAIAEIDWGDVLKRAAEGYGRFLGMDDPKRAAAALKQAAALSVVDPNAAKQKLTQALDQYFADRVQGAVEKFQARTRYILPATRAAGDFVRAFLDWARNTITEYASFFGGAVSAVAVYAGFLGVLFADAVKNGGIAKDEALNILNEVANALKGVLDVIVDGKGVEATVSVDLNEANATVTYTISIPDPAAGNP